MKLNKFIVGTAAITLLGFASCMPKQEGGQNDPQVAENIERTKAAYAHMMNGNMDSVTNYIAADFVDHNPDPMMTKQGLEGMKEMMAMYKSSFPDMKMEVNEIMGQGDLVLVHATISGTNTGAMGPMPATNKSFKVDMYEKLRIKDGKMVERWGVFDEKNMMVQLGMMPAMPGAPTAEAGTPAPAEGEKAPEPAKK